MGRVSVSAASVLVIGTCSAICRAQEHPDSVTLMGRISDPQGKPIPGAGVRIVGRRLTARTDANGVYRFAGVTPEEGTGADGTLVPSRAIAPTLNGKRILFGMEAAQGGGVFYTLSGRQMRGIPNTRWDTGAARAPLRKAAGDFDSLIVSAAGYAPARREIGVFTGMLDFTLTPAAVFEAAATQSSTQGANSP